MKGCRKRNLENNSERKNDTLQFKTPSNRIIINRKNDKRKELRIEIVKKLLKTNN